MALLNPPQILPAVARVLFRALQGADDFGMPRAELAKSVAPATLPRSEGAPTGPGSKGFDDTLTACLMIGLFDSKGDFISLHPDLPGQARDRRQHDHDLRSMVRGLVLREALNFGLWDSAEGARDLTRALAWYLAQNPLNPPAPWNEADGVDVAQERQFGAGERVFSNDTRWGAFDRWAVFLGFGHHLPRNGKDVLLPDPTEAVRHVIPSVLTRERREIGVMIEELGQRIPVLDGGAYRRDLESRMRPEAARSGGDLLSPSLAYALLRLRDEQLIVLEDLADAPLKIRLPERFGPERTITHASLGSPTGIRRQTR
jgi:hypothetical protein